MTITTDNHHEHGPVLDVTGEVDMHTAPRLTQALQRVLQARPARLVVDLSDVSYMGSAGVEALTTAQRFAGSTTLFAVVATGAALRPLQLTHTDSTIATYPHRSMALTCTAAALAPA
ncbi:STAS domain-containing protein [Nocardia sp. NPDC050712]|uniref:STAS domain-containing protein n=1 Tax=Nocardia sp. NPDC050712 TaxID=3155518 RepID=UPI0033FB347C